MQIRKSNLIGTIVAAAALVGSTAGAQTFEQSVTDALNLDGSVLSQVSPQKLMSTQDPEMIMAMRGPGGGGGGNRGGGGGNHGGGNHGGGNPGRGPGNPGRGPGNPGRGPGNPGRGPGNPGRGPGNPGRGGDHRGGEHRGNDHRGGHEGHAGHSRPDWHGHGGGWGEHGHGRYGWRWDAWNRPVWLGWVVWSGVGSCRAWYDDRLEACNSDCDAELDACVDSGADEAVCEDTHASCADSCDYQYDSYWGQCTF